MKKKYLEIALDVLGPPDGGVVLCPIYPMPYFDYIKRMKIDAYSEIIKKFLLAKLIISGSLFGSEKGGKSSWNRAELRANALANKNRLNFTSSRRG